MLEARGSRKCAMVVKVCARLRCARDRFESDAGRERGEKHLGANGATSELGVGDDERRARVRREHAMHRAQ